MKRDKLNKIYITHCSAKKNDALENTKKKVTPDKLYTATPLVRFINKCKKKKVRWAIFSDKYGVVFPHTKIAWYEKHPNDITDEEFSRLVNESAKKLRKFDRVYFYGNHKSHYFHRRYKLLIRELIRRGINVIKICSIYDIKG